MPARSNCSTNRPRWKSSSTTSRLPTPSTTIRAGKHSLSLVGILSRDVRRRSKSLTTDEEQLQYSHDKTSKFRVGHPDRPLAEGKLRTSFFQSPKSHRLIEKRRRDRLNHSLSGLLNLIPHQKPEVDARSESHETACDVVRSFRINGASRRSKSSKWPSSTCTR